MLDYHQAPAGDSLRRRLRESIAENFPTSFLGAFTDDPADLELTERYCRVLGQEGLLVMAWPREFGGGDASIWEQTVLREEMWAAHEPRGPQYMGLNWVGPAIMKHGTPDQRATHLARIAEGRVVWCQGFSEPEAGSDLPALRTRAAHVTGGWRISGQKIWTSYARMAQWCFLLARTGSAESRQAGITVFLVDMKRPGITVRPIDSMLGPHHLNEVFLDDVLVTEGDVLGEVDRGWDIVLDVLRHERLGIARYARCDRLLTLAPQVLGGDWEDLPSSLRQRWAVARVRTRQVRLLAYSLLEAEREGSVDDARAALYRMAVTQLDQEVAEVLADIVGAQLLVDTTGSDTFPRAVEDHWRYAQASTVASGTLEMQRRALWKGLADQS